MKAFKHEDLIIGQKYFDIKGEDRIELLFTERDEHHIYFDEVYPQDQYDKDTEGRIGFSNVGHWYQED